MINLGSESTRMRSSRAVLMKKLLPIVLTALFLASFFHVVRATTDYAHQPEVLGSTLPTVEDDVKIEDKELSNVINSYIGSNYKDMIFVFGQCFGGGFIDDIDLVTDGKNPVAVMSASRYNQRSFGELGATGQDYFLKAFADAVENDATRSIKVLFYEAESNDEYGPNGKRHEDPQFLGQPQPSGDDIKIRDGGSNYAILFAGNPSKVSEDDATWRHWNDMERIRNILLSLGYSDNDIFAYYGDKTKPDNTPTPTWVDGYGTESNLTNAFAQLKNMMGSTATLFFWVTDHGDPEAKIPDPPQIPPGQTGSTVFSLYPDFIGDIVRSTRLPFLSIQYANVKASGNSVYMNGLLLGTIPGSSVNGETKMTFNPVTVPLFETNNNVTIQSFQSEVLIIQNMTLSANIVPQELPAVGGLVVPTGKLRLLLPYIGLASAMLVVAVAATIFVKRGKRKPKADVVESGKEKQ